MTMLDILPWSFDHRTTSSYQEFSSASEKSPICLEVRGWQIAPFICHMRITQTWHSLTNPRYVMITSKPAKASVEKYKFALVADNFLWHYHSVLSHQEKVRYVQLVQYVSWRMASADNTWKIQLTNQRFIGRAASWYYVWLCVHSCFVLTRFPKQGLTKQKQPTIELQVSYYAKNKTPGVK